MLLPCLGERKFNTLLFCQGPWLSASVNAMKMLPQHRNPVPNLAAPIGSGASGHGRLERCSRSAADRSHVGPETSGSTFRLVHRIVPRGRRWECDHERTDGDGNQSPRQQSLHHERNRNGREPRWRSAIGHCHHQQLAGCHASPRDPERWCPSNRNGSWRKILREEDSVYGNAVWTEGNRETQPRESKKRRRHSFVSHVFAGIRKCGHDGTEGSGNRSTTKGGSCSSAKKPSRASPVNSSSQSTRTAAGSLDSKLFPSASWSSSPAPTARRRRLQRRRRPRHCRRKVTIARWRARTSPCPIRAASRRRDPADSPPQAGSRLA